MNENRLWHLISKDGSVTNRIRFITEDKKAREERIANYFLNFYKFQYGIELPARMIERDNPHDFTFSTFSVDAGEKLYLEIVAISDESYGFQKQSNQIRLEKLLEEKNYSVIAVAPPYASNKDLKDAVEEIERYPILNKDTLNLGELFRVRQISKKPVIRRIEGSHIKLLYCSDGKNRNLEIEIENAIKNKEMKGYKNISEMVLVIDEQLIDRTPTTSFKEYIDFLRRIQLSNFKEIFLYSEHYYDPGQDIASVFMSPLKTFNDSNLQRLLGREGCV